MTDVANLLIVALVSSMGAGCALACALAYPVQQRRRSRSVRAALGMPASTRRNDSSAAHGLVISLAQRLSIQGPDPLPKPLALLEHLGSGSFAFKLKQAGLAESVSVAGLCRARLIACVIACACLCLAGSAFSTLACIALGAVGALAGWLSVGRSLGRAIDERRQSLEGHLSQALEVLCLGLRAGLTFDRALALYCSCFAHTLARELQTAMRLWQSGMTPRDQALRNLAATYDSVLLSRVVEAIVRSLRFGSTLADVLEELAREARQSHRASVEEKVMKAPVKMMIPVGTLILPSMLMLVLGPILLDLVNGF